ncbi:phytoene/squalene synthase family protein [Hoeflea halophila]|nr:phytoene/squalene synthase family protein [Hoeflea halophila]
MSDQSRSEFLASLRAADIDRYLALLLMPAAVRDDLLVLFLFNAEIAAVRDRIREALPGEIRLQWWRDMVSGNRQEEAQSHPLASALLDVIKRRDLPVEPLTAMCDARIFDVYDDPMPDRTSYEGYAGETASALLQMSAFVLDPTAAASTSTASGHAGVAQAVAGHLMMLPITQARGQVFIPGDLLSATGLSRDSFLAAAEVERAANVIRGFAGFGREHLGKARAAFAGTPDTIRPAYLPVALVESVFNRAEKMPADYLSQTVRPPQWRRQWQLWRAARRGDF